MKNAPLESLTHIEFKSTAKEMCNRFESLFGNCITNSKVSLKLKLYDLNMNDSDELSDHVSKFGSHVRQLMRVKCGPDDEDGMIILVTSMYDVARFDQTC